MRRFRDEGFFVAAEMAGRTVVTASEAAATANKAGKLTEQDFIYCML